MNSRVDTLHRHTWSILQRQEARKLVVVMYAAIVRELFFQHVGDNLVSIFWHLEFSCGIRSV